MSCTLCGREPEGEFQAHWMGCARIDEPDLTDHEAVNRGLLHLEPESVDPVEKVEILKEGSMTTEPFDPEEYEPGEEGDADLKNCEYPDCTKAKYSNHPRVKYCEDHKDPKNRKE